MAVLVEEVMQAKTGKSLRVKLGGTWYGSALTSGLNAMKGQMIDAEISTGKFGPWIDKWAAVAQQNAAPQVPPPFTPPQAAPAVAAPITREREPEYAKPAPVGTVAPYWLPMASNVVAHGIAAGKIENPNQVAAWVRAVKMSVEAEQRDDDDVPY